MMSTMQSLIIAAKDREKGREFTLQFCTEKQISTFDITFVDLEGETAKTKGKLSIGINDIKQMQKNLYLKPLTSSHKAVIITNAETLTIEAQNALLKTLEEPPEYAFLILLANNKEVFLPTILSRCKIVSLDAITTEETTLEQYIKVLQELPELSISQKLKLAQDSGKTKEAALDWLEHMILATRGAYMDQKHNYAVGKKIRLFQETYTIIKTTNVLPRFALENLLLSI